MSIFRTVRHRRASVCCDGRDSGCRADQEIVETSAGSVKPPEVNEGETIMDETLKAEIGKIALGYDLKYKISNMRMETYLAPAYAQLKKRHPELHYEEFIEELVKVRAHAREEARKRA